MGEISVISSSDDMVIGVDGFVVELYLSSKRKANQQELKPKLVSHAFSVNFCCGMQYIEIAAKLKILLQRIDKAIMFNIQMLKLLIKFLPCVANRGSAYI